MLDRLTQRMSLFWLLQLSGWLAFGMAMMLSRPGMYPLWYMALNKGVLASLGLLTTLGLRGVYRKLWQHRVSLLRLLVVTVACSYLASLVWTAAFNFVVAAYHDWVRGEPFALEGWFILVNGSLYHAFVLMAWSVLYFAIKYYQALQDEQARVLRAEARAHEAQLQALRYQVHPHFLFNTLNAISTLVVEARNEEARRMIARLSDFLRLTLDGTSAPQVPLVEELAFVERYLDIERIRFQGRLTTEIDADPEAYAALVPVLLLQPLVENAVRHGIAPQEDGGRLLVTARRVSERLHLRVEDTGQGLAGRPADVLDNGVGLANVRARLQERYGDDHRFELNRSDRGGVAVTIELPYHIRPEAPAAPVASSWPDVEVA